MVIRYFFFLIFTFSSCNNFEINKSQVSANSKEKLEIEECLEKRKTKAIEYYKRYNLHDSVTVYFPINSVTQNAVYYDCPDNTWEEEINNGLKVRGSIEKKMYSKDSLNIYFDLKIFEINNIGITILGNKVVKGDIIKVNLNNILLVDNPRSSKSD